MWIDCGRTKLQTVRKKKFSQSIRPPFFISFCAKDASAVESAEAKCTERMLSYSLHVYGWFLLDRSRSLRFTNVRKKKKKKVVCHLHSRPCISAIASANLADVFVLLFIYLYFINFFFLVALACELKFRGMKLSVYSRMVEAENQMTRQTKTYR